MKAYLFAFDFNGADINQRRQVLGNISSLSYHILPLSHNIFLLSFDEPDDLNFYLVRDYVNLAFDETTILLIYTIGTFTCQMFSKHRYTQWKQLDAMLEQCRKEHISKLIEELNEFVK